MKLSMMPIWNHQNQVQNFPSFLSLSALQSDSSIVTQQALHEIENERKISLNTLKAFGVEIDEKYRFRNPFLTSVHRFELKDFVLHLHSGTMEKILKSNFPTGILLELLRKTAQSISQVRKPRIQFFFSFFF